jgi:hypothetical protein
MSRREEMARLRSQTEAKDNGEVVEGVEGVEEAEGAGEAGEAEEAEAVEEAMGGVASYFRFWLRQY